MLTNLQTVSAPNRPNLLRRAWQIVRADWKAYLSINAVYYGLVLLGMAYVAFLNPGLQETLLKSTRQAFTEGPLSSVASAYSGEKVVGAMLLTFITNLFLGSAVEITLPSLIVPFSGLLMGLIRAVLWGLILSPSNPGLAGPMIPHSLVLLLEGQAYVMTLLAAFIHGKALLSPQIYGVQGRVRGYREGLKRTGWIYLLVVLLLLVAAIYEAIEVIFLAPMFR